MMIAAEKPNSTSYGIYRSNDYGANWWWPTQGPKTPPHIIGFKYGESPGRVYYESKFNGYGKIEDFTTSTYDSTK